MREKLLAIGVVLIFFGLIWLYVREFPLLSNTLQLSSLLTIAFFFGILIAWAGLWLIRSRIAPIQRHVPEVLLVIVFSLLFSPLFVSLLNRMAGVTQMVSFAFISERPYYASNYGILKGEKIKPSGFQLTVSDAVATYRFKYASQAYFPLTRKGEMVMLPIRKGLLGIEVMELQ